MNTVIGIDLGTSSVKALLMDENGKVLASQEVSYPLYNPNPGWAEQNPDEWWQATQVALRKLSQDIHELSATVLGIGLSGQMNGAVLLDERFQAIRPSIIWVDARTVAQCEKINSRVDRQLMTSITGKLAVTGYTAPKLLWVREHEPEHFKAVRHILLPKDFIRLRLTGELFTDFSDASNTLLFDIQNNRWSPEMLDALELDEKLLPIPMPSMTITGVLSPQAAEMTGLAANIPVIAGAGDSSAEAIGSGLVNEGPVLSVIGSAGNISATSSHTVIDSLGRIHTGSHVTDQLWILTGVQQAAGLSIRWIVENLRLFHEIREEGNKVDPYEMMINHACAAPSGSEGLVYLPYLTGERTPHLDPLARGVFFGIDIRHTRDHFARAVLEGIAFSQRDAIELLVKLGVPTDYLIAAGGGSRSSLWRQILANVANLPVMTSRQEHSAAYGAALLAATTAGMYGSIEEACQATVSLSPGATPQPEYRERYDKSYDIFRTVYQNLRPVFSSNL
jgi:xylulokinase